MKIQTHQPQIPMRKLSSPTPPPPTPPAPGQPGDAFYQGASSCSKFLTMGGGGLLGAKVGFVAGSLIGATQGSAAAMMAGSLVGVAALGLAGAYGMGAMSDFAGRLGRDLDTANPVRGEALGRTALGAGLAYLGGGSHSAVLHAGLSAGTGVLSYAFRS